jgi:hypothetical protein
VENHLHGRVLLVYENGMVRAVVEKYAKALSIEVILVVHPHGKIGAKQTWAGGQGQEETNSDSGEHRLGANCSFASTLHDIHSVWSPPSENPSLPVFTDSVSVDDLSGIQILREQAAEPIVHRFFQILLATQVALGCQYRHMAKKKLDSLQFASIHVTKLCTGSPAMPHAASYSNFRRLAPGTAPTIWIETNWNQLYAAYPGVLGHDFLPAYWYQRKR